MDYEMQPSVRGVLAVPEHALVGTVVAWHPGPIVRDPDGIGDLFAVLEIKVEQRFAPSQSEPEADGEAASRRAYVRVSQGPFYLDEQGNVLPLENGNTYAGVTLRDLRSAIPAGTPVLALGNAVTPDVYDYPGVESTVVRWWASDGGEPLIDAHPQGLLLETADGAYESGSAQPRDVAIAQWRASPKYRGPHERGAFASLIAELAPPS